MTQIYCGDNQRWSVNSRETYEILIFAETIRVYSKNIRMRPMVSLRRGLMTFRS